MISSEVKIYKSRIFLLIFILVFLSSCATAHTQFMRNTDLKRLKDGTYKGDDTTFLCSVKLATTIKAGEISDIKILSHYVTYPLAGRAYAQIPERIIKAQTLDVDAVTAATVSTNNIKRAVLDALEKAK